MRSRIGFLFGWTALVTVGHFSVGVDTHPAHLVHMVLAGLYLIPIVIAAQGWGLRGGLLSAGAVASLYLVHMAISWADQPMENANQVATMGVYFAIGALSGLLKDRQEAERRRLHALETQAQREAIIQGFASLGAALRHRNESTREHCERVARLAQALGRRMALSAEALERLRLAALIHDVGKIGLRDDLLLKPEELSPAERAEVERHPAFAAEILRPIRGAEAIAEIILAHHECPDGSGYPRRLRAVEIPLEARILRVADVFAALSEARPYKGPLAEEEVLGRMRRGAGTAWDEEAFRLLEELHAAGELAPLL